jgi:hypothetical protein
MSIPKHEIIISKGGLIQIESQEKSDQCCQLNDIAKMLGSVVSEEKKDHVPVYHDVHQRSV